MPEIQKLYDGERGDAPTATATACRLSLQRMVKPHPRQSLFEILIHSDLLANQKVCHV